MGVLYFVEAAIAKEGRAEDTRLRAAATGRRRELGEDTLGGGKSAKDDTGQWAITGQWAKGNGQ
jgi:hypothetical protein